MIFYARDIEVDRGGFSFFAPDFSAEQGDVILVIGSNGSGKTTFFEALSKFAKLKSGKIAFKGEDITNIHYVDRIKRGFMYLPQDHRGLLGHMSVRDNLELSHKNRKRREIKEVLADVYERFEPLYYNRNREAGLLSGGEKTILMFGRMIMSRAEFFVLDEPFIGLDDKNRKMCFAFLEEMNKEKGATIVFTDHKLSDSFSFADSVVGIKSGELLKDDIETIEEARELIY